MTSVLEEIDSPAIPLSVKFRKALAKYNEFDSISVRKDSDKYQLELKNIVLIFEKLKKIIQSNNLFSINEDIDELRTNQIRYLSIDYYLAKIFENNVKDRVKNLSISKNLYLQFLYSIMNYNLLNKSQTNKIENFKSNYDPKLNELVINDPYKKREEKINNFKQEKNFKEKLSVLNNPKIDLNNLDDEVIRNLYIDELKFLAIKSFQSIESILMELELLSNFPNDKITELNESSKTLELNDKRSETNSKLAKKEFADSFTDKVENFNVNSLTSPLISKEGKVLRPFTLVSNRLELNKKVQGYGQKLPTMSIDEYIDNELANGGMVKPEEPEKEIDEDNYNDADAETYKKRDWDDFTDTHQKGSGNTMNIG
ncbi:unnamed protein product [[Candida] boidinii]|nr:unnamed protein product [[Candida] boidinii]